MKILLLYYSRTERTAKLMDELRAAINVSRVIRIETEKPRGGLGGAIKSASESLRGAQPEILHPAQPPVMKDYDLVIIGAPIWAGKPASPVLSFLSRYKSGIIRAAYVLTSTSGGPQSKAMLELDKCCGLTRKFELSLGKPSDDETRELELFIAKVKTLEQEI